MDAANNFAGNQQRGMEISGGASSLQTLRDQDENPGHIDAFAKSDWTIEAGGPVTITFGIGEADTVQGSKRPGLIVSRRFWVHLVVVPNGFPISWDPNILWPDGLAVVVDSAIADEYDFTFTVEQRGAGTPLKVKCLGGGPMMVAS